MQGSTVWTDDDHATFKAEVEAAAEDVQSSMAAVKAAERVSQAPQRDDEEAHAAEEEAHAAAEAATPKKKKKRRGKKFVYLDAEGKEQGPFKQEKLLEWYDHGALPDDLQVRQYGQLDKSIPFSPLIEMVQMWRQADELKIATPVPSALPAPLMPATSSVAAEDFFAAQDASTGEVQVDIPDDSRADASKQVAEPASAEEDDKVGDLPAKFSSGGGGRFSSGSRGFGRFSRASDDNGRTSSAKSALGFGPDYRGSTAMAAASRVLGVKEDDGITSWNDLRKVMKQQIRKNAIKLLPIVLRTSFIAFPAVASLSLRAFLCEDFDMAPSALIADYSVECGGPEHHKIKRLAWGGITVYAFIIPLLYTALLIHERPRILTQRHSKLTDALSFLHGSYLPHYWYWELLEVFKRLYLMGFTVFVDPGSITQLMVSALVALIYLVFVMQASPMKYPEDDYLSMSTNFGLSCFFLFSIVLKMGTLATNLEELVGKEPLRGYEVNSDTLASMLILSMVLVFIVSFLLLLQNMAVMRRARRAAELADEKRTVAVERFRENEKLAEDERDVLKQAASSCPQPMPRSKCLTGLFSRPICTGHQGCAKQGPRKGADKPEGAQALQAHGRWL